VSGYRTIFTPDARADLRKIGRVTAMMILRKLAELESDPYGFGATALVSDPDIRRLRIGDNRIFYTVIHDQLVVQVVRVAHRATAHDD